MNWSTDEVVALGLRISDIEFGKRTHPGYPASACLSGWLDDDPKAQAQGANLSMDEVRTSLDEFEQIIRANLNFCSACAH